MKRKTPLKRTGIARGAPIDRRHTVRRRKDFNRVYGSKQRVEWVKAQPCAVPMCPRRPCENAHTANGGLSRKADAATIIPLCTVHHRELHACGVASFQRMHGGLSLAACAERTERAWVAYQEAA